jgi:hypothetical protein
LFLVLDQAEVAIHVGFSSAKAAISVRIDSTGVAGCQELGKLKWGKRKAES